MNIQPYGRFLILVPYTTAVNDKLITTALVNDEDIPLQLKNSGSYMLKQIIEYLFRTKVWVPEHVPEYMVSYKACWQAIDQIGGVVVRGLHPDGFTDNWNIKGRRAYLMFVPIKSIRIWMDDNTPIEGLKNWSMDSELNRLLIRDEVSA